MAGHPFLNGFSFGRRRKRGNQSNNCSKRALPAVKAVKTENLSDNLTTSQTQLVLIRTVTALGGTQDVAEGFAERFEACSTEEQLEICLTSLQQNLWPNFKGTLEEWNDHVQSIRTKIQGKQRRERYLENAAGESQVDVIDQLDNEL